jgi:probable HAF family extracellular repeat protein
MTDNCVSHARAGLPRATVTVFAALVVLSMHGTKVDARHATSFVAIDLGTLAGGSSSEAFAVNDKGVIVGSSTVDETGSLLHAFMWSERTGMMDLGTLRGTQAKPTFISENGIVAGVDVQDPAKAFAGMAPDVGSLCPADLKCVSSLPNAINSKGDVVGFINRSDGTSHAFLWTAREGVVHDLGTLDEGDISSANAINDDDVVVGESATKSGIHHAFMWTARAGMVDLGTLGSTSSAQGVNDSGVIVGNSQTMSGETHAFVWTRHTGMVDIGPTGRTSFAERISGRFVVGRIFVSGASGPQHGFVWTRKDGFVDIGTLDGDPTSFPTAVNERGLVVGNSFTPGNPPGPPHAFAWSASTGIVALTTPAGMSSQANATNNDNFIVGSICSSDGTCRATLWKPASHSRKDRNGDDD